MGLLTGGRQGQGRAQERSGNDVEQCVKASRKQMVHNWCFSELSSSGSRAEAQAELCSHRWWRCP